MTGGGEGSEGSVAICSDDVNDGMYTVELTLGTYPSEVSWMLSLAEGGEVMSASDFAGSEGDVMTNETCDECLFTGTPFTLEMVDAWGDGWTGSTITISDCDGNELATYSLADGMYGTEEFCLNITRGTKF